MLLARATLLVQFNAQIYQTCKFKLHVAASRTRSLASRPGDGEGIDVSMLLQDRLLNISSNTYRAPQLVASIVSTVDSMRTAAPPLHFALSSSP